MKDSSVLGSFTAALALRDSDTHAHCQRVAAYALVLGRRVGLSQDALIILEHGAFLHDLGKIHVPDRILKKAGPLNDVDWKVMSSHAITGYAMLGSNPTLTDAAEIVLAHHERYDGTGYPHRLEAEEIPLGARVCAVVDCLDSFTCSDSPYRRSLVFADACRSIEMLSGSHFDPQVIDAFASVSPAQWQQVRDAIVPSILGNLEWQETQRTFRDRIFNGDFDNPREKMVACFSVIQDQSA
jgi:HD-GYP domain-containing protein (c-di-GMP phosphodiesterase class II)